MKSEQSPLIRRDIAVDLNHHKFMQMADQVMAEFDKIDVIFEKCFGTAEALREAA